MAMDKKTREFQVFVKPVGARCNLTCSYCYYLDKKELYDQGSPLRMSDSILSEYIRQHIEATTEETVFFSWHGGEPLLAGLDFYRKAVEIQKKYLPAGKKVLNGIQTNGTLINEEWCSFFADEGFIAGVSIDGPEPFHNRFRKAGNTSVFDRVIAGYSMLRSFGIPSEILCVVNAENMEHPVTVYDFFRQMGAEYITFLPLVERIPGTASEVSPHSVTAEGFGIFLSKVFDEWVEKDVGTIKIQVIEEALRPVFGQAHTLCIFRENCGGVPVVERNGDFYSCDHYVDKEHLIGNITTSDLATMLDSSRQQAFGTAKSLTLPAFCRECEVKDMCNGECPKNRFLYTPDGEYGLNYLCSGYRLFFNHVRPFAEAVAAVWRSQEGKSR